MITRVQADKQGGGLLVPDGAVWLGRAYAGNKGHILRNPHRTGAECKARLHCKLNPCTACAPCDRGGVVHTRDEALRLYETHLKEHPSLILEAMRFAHTGQRGACSCPEYVRCHIDVLGDLIRVSKRLTAVQGRPARKTIRTSSTI